MQPSGPSPRGLVEFLVDEIVAMAANAGRARSPLREEWDWANLRTLTKQDPDTATGAHVCSIGHVTAAELAATVSANGFANRLLFVAVRPSSCESLEHQRRALAQRRA